MCVLDISAGCGLIPLSSSPLIPSPPSPRPSRPFSPAVSSSPPQ